MCHNLVRFGLAAFAMSGLLASFGMSPPDQENQGTEETREIARLQKAVSQTLKKLSVCRKRLAKAETTVEHLRRENTQLRKMATPDALAYVKKHTSMQLLDFYQWLAKSSRDGGFTLSQQRTLLGLLEAAMDGWGQGDSERMALVGSSRQWLSREVESLGARITREARNVPTLYGVGMYPATICEILKGLDRGEKAKAIARMVGREVTWSGVVVETVDSRTALYQLELDCDGVIVFVNVADKSPGALAGTKRGMEVYVKGRISDVGDTLGACISVLLAKCKVMDEREYLGLKPKKRKKHR